MNGGSTVPMKYKKINISIAVNVALYVKLVGVLGGVERLTREKFGSHWITGKMPNLLLCTESFCTTLKKYLLWNTVQASNYV